MREFGEYLWKDERKLRQRVVPSVAVSFAFVLTFLFTAPVETFFANTRFFEYTVGEVMLPVSLTALLSFALLTGILLLLRGRVYNWFVSLIIGLSVAGYVQTLFLNSSVGLLDGSKVYWSEMVTEGVLGLILWVAIIAAVFVLAAVKLEWWRFGVIFLSVLICTMQVTNTLAVILTYDIEEKNRICATLEGELTLSDKHNVIVLVADSFDIRFANEVMEHSPEYFDEFEGFTWYKNTTPHYSRTFPSVAHMFTGEKYNYDKEYSSYMADAWEDNTLLEDMTEAGYAPRFYVREIFLNTDMDYMAQYCDNYKEADRKINRAFLESEMLRLSMYKTMPVMFKQYFETDTTRLNAGMENIISMSDADFYDRLTQTGLSVDPNLGEKGSFSYYHFHGCHHPYRFDENCEITGEDDLTIRDATRGVLTNMGEYLRQLKELGIYDSSTIIITADHGHVGRPQELDRERVISLFYKPAGATGEMVIDEKTPQQQINVRATILDAMGVENSDFGTPFAQVSADDDTPRYFYMSGASEDGTIRELNLITYEITGDANNFENWEKISSSPIKYPFFRDN